MRVMKERGFHWFVAAIFLDNKLAKRLHKRIGSEYWGRVSYIQFMNHGFTFKRLANAGKKSPNLIDYVVSKQLLRNFDRSNAEVGT